MVVQQDGRQQSSSLMLTVCGCWGPAIATDQLLPSPILSLTPFPCGQGLSLSPLPNFFLAPAPPLSTPLFHLQLLPLLPLTPTNSVLPPIHPPSLHSLLFLPLFLQQGVHLHSCQWPLKLLTVQHLTLQLLDTLTNQQMHTKHI